MLNEINTIPPEIQKALCPESQASLVCSGNKLVHGQLVYIPQSHNVNGMQFAEQLIIGEVQGRILRQLEMLGINEIFAEGHSQDLVHTDLPQELQSCSLVQAILPETFSNDERILLCTYGASRIYCARHDDVTIRATEDYELSHISNREYRRQFKNPQRHSKFVMDEREKTAITKVLANYAPQKILIYGRAHDFKTHLELIPRNDRPETTEISVFPTSPTSSWRDLTPMADTTLQLQNSSNDEKFEVDLITRIPAIDFQIFKILKTDTARLIGLTKLVFDNSSLDSLDVVVARISEHLQNVEAGLDVVNKLQEMSQALLGPFSSFTPLRSTTDKIHDSKSVSTLDFQNLIYSEWHIPTQTYLIEKAPLINIKLAPLIDGDKGRKIALQKLIAKKGISPAIPDGSSVKDYLNSIWSSQGFVDQAFQEMSGIFSFLEGGSNHLIDKSILTEDHSILVCNFPVRIEVWLSLATLKVEDEDMLFLGHEVNNLSDLKNKYDDNRTITPLNSYLLLMNSYLKVSTFCELDTLLNSTEILPCDLFSHKDELYQMFSNLTHPNLTTTENLESKQLLKILHEENKGIFKNLCERSDVTWNWEDLKSMDSKNISSLITWEDHPPTRYRLIQEAQEVEDSLLMSSFSMLSLIDIISKTNPKRLVELFSKEEYLLKFFEITFENRVPDMFYSGLIPDLYKEIIIRAAALDKET